MRGIRATVRECVELLEEEGKLRPLDVRLTARVWADLLLANLAREGTVDPGLIHIVFHCPAPTRPGEEE